MVEKNADRLSRNLRELLSAAADARTQALFPAHLESADRRGSTKRMPSSVGEKFRSQLTQLMTTVEKTQPFFIRCKRAPPNDADARHRGRLPSRRAPLDALACALWTAHC